MEELNQETLNRIIALIPKKRSLREIIHSEAFLPERYPQIPVSPCGKYE